ncbi:uncharacterized protein LOC107271465 isoform X2 [Cephus cinctus]|uniref:Uncharacterized protein LOC107271465 isoform X2 n=1 Tax=Cephus cinctus TaxID=211228 RepID=A0AAJ7FQB4_CEPCN|nr:uncharacterized protein LOC107271465 isoform X2 [Cephus cinctus]
MYAIRHIPFVIILIAISRAENDVTEPILEISESEMSSNSSEVTEVQHATCKIITEELVANAQATVTRVLTGVCNAKTMNDRFDKLEKDVRFRLEEIKITLKTILREINGFHKDNDNSMNRKRIQETIRNDHQPVATKTERSSPRQDEINKFNITVHQISTQNGPARVFTYYWRVTDIMEKLTQWKSNQSLRSSTFHISQGGYAMFLRITPRHFPDDSVYFGFGVTRGRFDSILKWPFPLKTRIEILDHSVEGWRADRVSQLWDPSAISSETHWTRPKITEESDNPEYIGLVIPKRMILSTPLLSPWPSNPSHVEKSVNRYVWNDSILVKLTVFL